MELQTLPDSLKSVDDELYALQQNRQSHTPASSGHTTRKQRLEDEIMELQTAIANGSISDTDTARLEQLKVETDDAASHEEEFKPNSGVHGDPAAAFKEYWVGKPIAR